MKPLNQNKMTRQERLKEWIKTLNEEKKKIYKHKLSLETKCSIAYNG